MLAAHWPNILTNLTGRKTNIEVDTQNHPNCVAYQLDRTRSASPIQTAHLHLAGNSQMFNKKIVKMLECW